MNEIEAMTNQELRDFADQAYDDVLAAEPGTEWLDSCCAALLAACMEMTSRGMRPTHQGYLQ